MFGKGIFGKYVFVFLISFELFFLENVIFKMSFYVLFIKCRLVIVMVLNSVLVKYEEKYFFFWNFFML